MGSAGHPRVGGEHPPETAMSSRPLGSSPRGRGTLNTDADQRPTLRVIPAWAGNTRGAATGWPATAGHPRVGGEHQNICAAGSTPGGSSPRGRGTLSRCDLAIEVVRVIPAWAGNTSTLVNRLGGMPGHPRVGGEHLGTLRAATPASGSSPRGRGTPGDRPLERPALRVIPAWAGNTARSSTTARPVSGHPRVGGEHPGHGAGEGVARGSSPRGRGTQRFASCPMAA